MGNVNMEASQINYRNNSKPTLRNVHAALGNLFNSITSINGDINELTESVNYKADKIDIAPFFSEESHYYIGDLVYRSGRLWKFTANHAPGEWNQEEVTASNIDMAIKEAGGGGGGLTLKTLRYTGNGQAANVIDFGDETPAMIAGIYPDPDETYAGGDYNLIEPFGWGNRLTIAIWAGQSGGLPSGGGGTNMAILSYSGNTITITSANVRAACNVDTQAYVVKYLA